MVVVAFAVFVMVAAGAVVVVLLAVMWVLAAAAVDHRSARQAGSPTVPYVQCVRSRGRDVWALARNPARRKPLLIGCSAAGLLVAIGYGAISGGQTRKPDEPAGSGGPSAVSAATPTASAPAAQAPHPAAPSRSSTPTTGSQAAGPAVLGAPTRTSACHVRGELPDPACTPGAVFVQATLTQICTSGYSASVRDVPDSQKQAIYAAYGIETHSSGTFEMDHLVPLELEGNNSTANLWPERSPGYHSKDEVENRLHDAVCGHAVNLRTAQLQIAHDWRNTSAGAAPATETHSTSEPPTAPSQTTNTARNGSAPTDFCSTHQCIPSFSEGHGTIVQCADGQWSHSGGERGVCARHGGPM
jgi:hypothetical protein